MNSKPFWENRGLGRGDLPFLLTDDTELSYSEVFAISDMLMSGYERGLVAILCDKSVETVIGYIGALRNGLVPLLLDANSKPAAIERIFSAYKPDYLFDPRKGLKKGFQVFPFNKNRTKPHPNLSVLLGTSGSTGDPKFVRLSYSSLDACTKSICEYLALKPERRCISLLPFHYSYGLSVLNSVIESRSSLLISNYSILDRDLWPLIVRKRVTDLSGVPFMFEILKRVQIPSDALNMLQCVTQAGGRLNSKLTDYFLKLFLPNGINYFTMYGQTEASPRISYLPPELAYIKAGSVGIPISCGKTSIYETGAKFGEGELLYQGSNVALGYAYSRADIDKGDEFNGCLRTGDQVRIDNDGFIFILGRKRRFIKLQGISINLDYLESFLNEEGYQCIVVGRENLLVICHIDETNTEVHEFIHRNFTLHPTNVRIEKLDRLPINANGKPDYASLSERFL